MKVPINWLNQYLEKPLSARSAADAMELAGIEVEAVVPGVNLDPKIVVGHVLEVSSHPNADKLRLAKVDVKNTTLNIVCGASNLSKGQTVAVATVGAKLPDGTRIKEAVIRGQQLQGMLCSEQELGMGGNHDGILVLEKGSVPGSQVAELFPPQAIIDISTAANRWDLTSIIGIAREVSAHTKLSLELPESITPTSSQPAKLRATVGDPANAARYMLGRLSVDPTAKTPAWMQQALKGAGVRPISLIVDVTNYVLMEQGQPLHAFNAHFVTGSISVEDAKQDELFTTLDDKQRTLSSEDIVIRDTKQALAVAGVMGGLDSEVTGDTTEIILESASFHAGKIRKTAVRHGLRTEASARFERGVPVTACAMGLYRAIALLQEFGGAKLLEPIIDVAIQAPVEVHLSFTLGQIESVLGMPVGPKQLISSLKMRGVTVAEMDTVGTYLAKIPWWRPDIETAEDIAEEVMKLIGYDKLPATIPVWRPKKINFDNVWAKKWQAKATLQGSGLFEVVTYSFISKKQITDLSWQPEGYLQLQNPLSSEQEYLRAELLPSLLTVAAKNRQYAPAFGVYEFSKVFHKTKPGELPREPLVLGVLRVVPSDGYVAIKQVFDSLCRQFNVAVAITPKVFSSVTHPAQSAAINVGGEQIGSIFTVHPNLVRASKATGEIGYFEINWPKFMAAAQTKRYEGASKYPSIRRDISLLVDRATTWRHIVEALPIQSPLISVAYVGDYYGDDLPPSKKAITIRLEFASHERTLTDLEANSGAEKAVADLSKAVGATVKV